MRSVNQMAGLVLEVSDYGVKTSNRDLQSNFVAKCSVKRQTVTGSATLVGRPWWIVGVVASGLLSALSFIKFLEAPIFYSAWYGLLSLALTLLASCFMARLIRPEAISSAGFIGMIARYILALVLSIFATGVLVLLFGIFRVG